MRWAAVGLWRSVSDSHRNTGSHACSHPDFDADGHGYASILCQRRLLTPIAAAANADAYSPTADSDAGAYSNSDASSDSHFNAGVLRPTPSSPDVAAARLSEMLSWFEDARRPCLQVTWLTPWLISGL